MAKWLKTQNGGLIDLEKVGYIVPPHRDRHSDKFIVNALFPGIAVNNDGDEIFDYVELYASNNEEAATMYFKKLETLFHPLITIEV